MWVPLKVVALIRALIEYNNLRLVKNKVNIEIFIALK